MPVIPSGYFLAAYQFDCPAPGGTRRSVCTMGHQGLMVNANLQALAESFQENIWDNMGSSAYTFRGVVGYTETTADYAVRQKVGTLGASPMAPNVTLLMRKQTGRRGKAFNGRCYWPGMVYESDVDASGVINPTQLQGFNQFFNSWQSELNTLELEPYLFHGEISDPTPIEDLVIDGTVATQRRRLRR